MLAIEGNDARWKLDLQQLPQGARALHRVPRRGTDRAGGRPVTRARLALLRGMASLPALLVLAAAPAAAAHAGRQWVALCENGRQRWIAIELPTRAPSRDSGTEALCAHATCPRETRIERRGRG